jgi:N-terminal domain of (some) glycogen debranching enzymes
MKRDDCFLVFDSHGDIGASPGGPDGLFNCDTRYLSHFGLLINGLQPPRPGLPTFSGWWSRMRRIMGSIGSQVPITFLIAVGRCHEVLYDRRVRQRNSLSSNQFSLRSSPTDP